MSNRLTLESSIYHLPYFRVSQIQCWFAGDWKEFAQLSNLDTQSIDDISFNTLDGIKSPFVYMWDNLLWHMSIKGLIEILEQFDLSYTIIDDIKGDISEEKETPPLPSPSSDILHYTISVELPDPSLCCVCKERQKTVLFSPCYHLCTCEKCSVECEKCPLCNQMIDLKKKVFV